VLLFAVVVAGAHSDGDQTLGLPGVWPLPQSLSFGRTRGILSAGFKVNVVELQDGLAETTTASGTSRAKADMVEEAVARYSEMCFSQGGSLERSGGAQIGTQLEALRIEVPAATRNPLDLQDAAENYTLEVSFPEAVLSASSGVGVLRGLETFCQMLQDSGHGALSILQANITDYPRFGFRGLLVDSSRHFLPLAVLRENVDAMLYNKMNVLHWHIVDGNSFPYVSKVFPKLSEEGAYSPRETYTIEEVVDFVEFARLRGVRVLPEFDTPGHVFPSWGHGYPEVVTKCKDGTLGPLRADLNATYDFLKSLFTEVSSVFPDQYLHLGGDEVKFDCWNSNDEVSKFMKARNLNGAGLETYFEQRLLDIVGGIGKSYIVWQDIFNNGVTVKPDTVIDVWRKGFLGMGFDRKTLEKAAAQNFKVIVSGGWYLDDGDGKCCKFDGWKFYAQDPADFKGGVRAEARGRLMGGKACMWSEHVDATNHVSRIWPRASAVAERLWSHKSANNQTEADPRLTKFRCSMISRGIRAEPVDPGFCAGGVPYTYAPPYGGHPATAGEIIV